MIKSKIKILFVYPASDLGGIAQFILAIVRNMSHDRFDIHVAVFGNGPLCDLLKKENIVVHNLRVDYSLLSFIQAVYSLRNFLKIQNYDIIHAHNAKAGFLCSISNIHLQARIVYTGHSFRFDQKKKYISKYMFYLFEKFICRSAAYSTTLSKSELQFGITNLLLEENKSCVAPMSIDLDRFIDISTEKVESIKNELGIPNKTYIIGMIGRITSQKDPDTFLKAAALLSSRFDNMYFVWVGEGELRENITIKANALGISNRMIITGHQDPKRIPELLSMIDVLFFTSIFEGLPIALLEAMAAKKLIVAANVGSIQDIILDGITGWLYDSGDYHKAAAIIENIFKTNNRKNVMMRNAAYACIVDKYSPKEKIAVQFQNIYETVFQMTH